MPIRILVVEDNVADADIICEILEEFSPAPLVTRAVDGEIALKILQQQGEFRDVPLPHLVLLDLNLPRRDGREVLIEARQTPALRKIPIIILTSSSAQQDVIDSYEHGVNCYLTKPLSFRGYQEILTGLENFWCRIARLPLLGV